jgi:ABC-2 type transport system ATP-binding protein
MILSTAAPSLASSSPSPASASPSPSPILTVANLSKSFGLVRAADNISFTINKGDILGLLGHNGAGKSTIIRCLLGIRKPDRGTITYHIDTSLKTNNSKIGYLPEERGLYREARVMDLLVYLAGLKNYPADKARRRVQTYLAQFDLKGRERAKISTLSKGMAQKIQFIAAVLHEPELLILDEPISGLDPMSQDIILREVRALAEAGTTILLSAHQMNFVESLCTHIFMLHKGRQIFYGSLRQLKKQHGTYTCEVTGAPPDMDFRPWPFIKTITFDGTKHILELHPQASVQEFLAHMPQDIGPVDEFRVNRLPLHDIFVNLVTAEGGDLHD